MLSRQLARTYFQLETLIVGLRFCRRHPFVSAINEPDIVAFTLKCGAMDLSAQKVNISLRNDDPDMLTELF